MLLVRRFEEGAAQLYRDGDVPGFVHVSLGQEATAVGACWPLRLSDGIVSTHRGHGHCLAKGAEPVGMFAELMGRSTGTCGGFGGSMHIADVARGVFGANGIVGAGLPIAAGIAQAMRLRDRDDVVVAFFGDGAVATGAFHEAMNLAGLWRLPILFLCENNHYAEFTDASTQHRVPVIERVHGYGFEGVAIDGNDVLAVAATARDLVARLRVGEGPFLVEADTYRWHGHYEGDQARYRDPDIHATLLESDPVARCARLLDGHGLHSQRAAVDAAVESAIANAIDEARAAPPPDPSSRGAFVTRARPVIAEGAVAADAEAFRVMDAVREALLTELEDRDDVWLAGIDVGAGGNIYGITRGLWSRFEHRVLDTPIAETAIVGLAVGGAMAGTRPVVEIMYMDFIGVCLDQIMNQAAKLPFMTGGSASMALVIRTQIGAGRSSGAQHSQSLEAMLAHIPGLVVVMPSTPADFYGLLRASIADPNPVVFVEHRFLYGKKGPRPPRDHLVPIGVAAVRREGRDLTIISWSKCVDHCLDAAERAAAQSIDAEVIDLRTIAPLDTATLMASVAKTGRVLIVHEAVTAGGFGAELAARIAEECFFSLDCPPRRLGAPFTPAPYAPSLEEGYVPDAEQILAAIVELSRQ
ncbi:MAG: dehydrogenase E1 component subunit alpha/beta [Acidimicrobiales bacterium]